MIGAEYQIVCPKMRFCKCVACCAIGLQHFMEFLYAGDHTRTANGDREPASGELGRVQLPIMESPAVPGLDGSSTPGAGPLEGPEAS